jgi:hypothetical protein
MLQCTLAAHMLRGTHTVVSSALSSCICCLLFVPLCFHPGHMFPQTTHGLALQMMVQMGFLRVV